FGFFGPKELAARRQIEKELPDFNRGSGPPAGGFDFENFFGGDHNLRTFGGFGFALAAGQGETADTGNTGQSFAAKAHGSDGGQILGALNFAGGMTLEAEESVIAAHADAIIGNANEAAATGLDFDRDAPGAGIEGVLDQFFDDAGGPLDHLARRDLVGDL